jgi:hypothetical protein
MKKSEIGTVLKELIGENLKDFLRHAFSQTQPARIKSFLELGYYNDSEKFMEEQTDEFDRYTGEEFDTFHYKSGQFIYNATAAMRQWNLARWLDHHHGSRFISYKDEPTYEEFLKFNKESESRYSKNEGFGYVHDKDMKKDPKHISGERWRIKFDSDSKILKELNPNDIVENIKSSEVKEIIQEIINEMWAGFEKKKNLKENQIQGQSIPKDAKQIADLIFKLKEGELIWFSGDIHGRSEHGYGVEKREDGDEYIYRTTGKYGEYLEEEDIVKFAQEVVNDKYAHYYFVNNIQGYKKKPYEGDPDHDIGDYERYGPDPIEPQFETILKQKKKHLSLKEDDKNNIDNSKIVNSAWETAWFIKKSLGNGRDIRPSVEALLHYIEQLKSKTPPVQQQNNSLQIKQNINEIAFASHTFHTISRPVKNRQISDNEWIVKWMTNGKRDEDKTYYTDDEEDAWDSYRDMVKWANQENLKMPYVKTIIVAESGPQEVYFTNSPTQGMKMIPSAFSIARRLTKTEAEHTLPVLQKKWPGIKNWMILAVLE